MSLYIGNKKIAGLYKGENIEQASEQYAGVIQIASQEETNEGIIDNKAITPQKLNTKINSELNDFIEIKNIEDVELVEKSDLDEAINQLKEEIAEIDSRLSESITNILNALGILG